MPLNKKNPKKTIIIDEFQNKEPEYAIIQFSKFNVFKTSSIWVVLFISFAIFGFFIGRIFEGNVNYQISQLDIVISLWGIVAFVLSLWFIFHTKRFRYALSFLNYIHSMVLSFVFIINYLLYKLSVYGKIDDSNLNSKVSIKAIWILFYLWMTFYMIIIFSWYLTTFLNRRKYNYAFLKSSFLLPIIILFLTSPFYILNFNEAFIVENELVFLIGTFIFLIAFLLIIAFLSKYQTFGQTNLKIVNKVFGAELSYSSFGSIVGVFVYQTYWVASNLYFSIFSIIAIVLSIIMIIFFLGAIIYQKKYSQNSFFNKIIVKAFVIATLIKTITLVYIATSDIKENAFGISLGIVIPFFGSIFIFFIVISSILKVVVFERWPNITKGANFTIAFLFIFTQALIATLEDGKILYDWLGHFLILILLSIYAIIEIGAFIPELIIVLISTPKKSKKLKNLIIKKEVRND